jgi:hypothetical protein
MYRTDFGAYPHSGHDGFQVLGYRRQLAAAEGQKAGHAGSIGRPRIVEGIGNPDAAMR